MDRDLIQVCMVETVMNSYSPFPILNKGTILHLNRRIAFAYMPVFWLFSPPAVYDPPWHLAHLSPVKHDIIYAAPDRAT